MFHPTQTPRGKGALSHLKISAPEIAAIVGGAVLSIGLLGTIVLIQGGNHIGGFTTVSAPSESIATAPQPPAPTVLVPPAASPKAAPVVPTTATSSTTMGSTATTKPSPASTSAVHLPRPRPAHTVPPAPPPTETAKRMESTVSKGAAPAKAAPVKANASPPAALAAPTTKTAEAPRITKPAPPLQRAPSQAAATKPAGTVTPAPSKTTAAKTAHASATAATTTTPAPTGPVRIVIDYEAAAPGMSDMADHLARKLRAEGYKPVEIRPVKFIVSANQVRFFFAQDHDAAKRIEGIVAKVKDPGGAERRFAVTEFAHLKHPPPDNLVEIWLRSW